jgi:hypothetical protein
MPLNAQQQYIIDKIAKKAHIVLDEYLKARMQYTFICNMIDDNNVYNRFDNSRSAHIFNLIIFTFLHDSIKSLYNIVFDKNKSSASIHNLLNELHNNKSIFEEDQKSDISLYLPKEIAHKQAMRLHRDFLKNCENFAVKYDEIKNHPDISKIRKIRNKVVSHIDISTAARKIQRTNIGHFDLHWDQIDTIVDDVEKLVDLALACCASTSHFFQNSKDQYLSISKEFWDISRSKG